LRRAARVLWATLVAALLMGAPSSARTWPHGDPDTLIRGVLAQPVYRAEQTVDQPPQLTELEQLEQYLGKWFRAHFGFMRRLFHGVRGTGNVLGVILLAAVAVGLIAAGVRLAAVFTRKNVSRDDEGSAQDALGRARSAAQWRTLAFEAAARSDYNTAIAALFLSALQLLDESGVLHFDAARTPGEYRRLVRSTLRVGAPAFDGLTGGFVQAMYGEQSTSRDDYDAAQRSYAAFAPAVTQG
jgi:hypothetical protein